MTMTTLDYTWATGGSQFYITSGSAIAPSPSTPYSRARDLLLSHLTQGQRQQFANEGYFEVIGAATGRTYRIYARAHSLRNVTWMRNGKRRVDYDAYPSCGRRFCTLPGDDVLLAQKLALENRRMERQFLRKACATYHYSPVIWPDELMGRIGRVLGFLAGALFTSGMWMLVR